ncbi:MAG: OmpA family protein [Chitinophagales bacterium]
MKKIVIIAFLFLGITTTQAQNESGRWAFGASVSVIDFSGPQTKQYFNLKQYRANQRYFVGRYLDPSFNLKADFTFGKVWFPSVTAYPNVVEGKYENRHIYDFGVNVEYKLNNGYILKEEAIVAPYIFTGLGLNSIIDYGKAKGSDVNTYIPFGAGLTVRALNWLSFNLQSSYKLNLDNSFDYTQHSVGVVLNLGGKPKGATATDIEDQVIDSDEDGVTDLIDECPFAAGSEAMFGCPDTDGDGLGDSRDDCPNVAGSLINKGCPAKDSDEDGIPDDKDSCPTVKGEKRYAGCPDTDGDGIVDKYDKCPEEAGVASNSGCPATPVSNTNSNFNTNNETNLNTNTNVNTNTKPVVTPPVNTNTAIVGSSTSNTNSSSTVTNTTNSTSISNANMVEKVIVYFGSASDVVPNTEKAKLTKILATLKANPSYKLLIKGYTDKQGDSSSNVELSLKRATTVWMYLSNNGMDGDKAELYGYGEYSLEAATDKGNRRVVVEIVK